MMCVLIDDSDKRSFKFISHTPQSIDTWLNELHKKAKGNIAVVAELTKDPILYAFRKTVLSLFFLSRD
jgi:hypothetical protein